MSLKTKKLYLLNVRTEHITLGKVYNLAIYEDLNTAIENAKAFNPDQFDNNNDNGYLQHEGLNIAFTYIDKRIERNEPIVFEHMKTKLENYFNNHYYLEINEVLFETPLEDLRHFENYNIKYQMPKEVYRAHLISKANDQFEYVLEYNELRPRRYK